MSTFRVGTGLSQTAAVRAVHLTRAAAIPGAVGFSLAEAHRDVLPQLLVMLAGAVWAALSGWLFSDWPPEVIVAGDAAFLGLLMAFTGGADSPLRFFLVATYIAPALVFTPRRLVLMISLLSLAYFVPAAVDIVTGHSFPADHVTGFLIVSLWVGAVAVLFARLRERVQEAALETADARRLLLSQVLDSESLLRRTTTTALHEGPLQLLLTARQDLQEAGEGDAEALQLGREGIDAAIADIRATVSRLHPVALEHAGLEAAVAALLTSAEQHGLRTFLDCGDGVPDAVQPLVVDVVRVAVEDIVELGAARAVTVTIAVEHGAVAITVLDDATGPRPSADEVVDDRDPHIGVAATRERLEALGGWLRVGESGVRAGLPVPG